MRPSSSLVARIGIVAGVSVLSLATVGTAREPAKRTDLAPIAFQSRLRNGTIVRLVYIGDGDIAKGATWRPDGSPAVGSDIDAVKHGLGDDEDAHSQPGGRSIYLNFQLADLKLVDDGGQFNPLFRVLGNKDAQYGGGYSTADRSLYRDYWTVPKSTQSLDVICAVAIGGFRTAARGPIGDGKLNARVDGSGNHCSLNVDLPRPLRGKDLHLRAFDSSGKEIPSQGGALSDAFGNSKSFSVSLATDVKNVVAFELDARDFQRVIFRGARLLAAQPPPP